jgi:membrane fusion protein (multidrug efflux system)
MVGQIILGQRLLPHLLKRDGYKFHREGQSTTLERPSAQSLALENQTGGGGSPHDPQRQSHLKSAVIACAALLALAGAGFGGTHLYRYLTSHESTDDAYTTGHMHPISSRIDGTVTKVMVDDNEHVKAGQVLVQLDPRDYQVKVQEAQAALEIAKRQAEAAKTSIALASTTAVGKTTEATGNVSNAIASIKQAQATVAESQSAIIEAQHQLEERKAEETRASLDYTRYQNLAQQGAVSLQQRDQAYRDYQVAVEARKAAEQAITQATAKQKQAEDAVGIANAQLTQSQGTVQQAQATHVQTQVNAQQYQVASAAIAQAQAQLNDAQLQLSYTNIVAPIDGRVGKKSVEEGQRVQPGQQLLNVVSDDAWVVANFKETQLEHMRPNQPVEVKIDSFPHHVFTGTVDSVSPGSGSTFALLPTDNATGNFTKIVQRIPVKVILDPQSIKGYEQVIVPGMSVVVTVSVAH